MALPSHSISVSSMTTHAKLPSASSVVSISRLQALEFDHAPQSVDVKRIAPVESAELSVEVRLEVRYEQLVCVIVAMVGECGALAEVGGRGS